MARAKYCVFVGRFQPFHNGHLKVLLSALEEADQVIVVIGSYNAPATIKNPWDFDSRAVMVYKSVPLEYRARVVAVPLRDYTYKDITWITALQNTVSKITGNYDGAHSKIIGCFKDDSSYYLKLFPQWELVREPYHDNLDSTDIRRVMFEEPSGARAGKIAKMVPPNVAALLENYTNTKEYQELKSEWEFLKRYKESWKAAPFPPVFVTTDAVVIQAGHVLLVRRGINPGKGKLALPGGFVGQNESIYDSAIRELKEETALLVPRDELDASLVDDHVFDHPSRDMRGRTITHAFCFKLPAGGALPEIKGGDDAKEAVWMPINELALHEGEFFSDHMHIINYFVSNA